MFLFSSLTTRLIALVIGSIAISLAGFVFVTAHRLERGAKLQEVSVYDLIGERFANEMALQTQIILTEFERLETETAGGLAAVADQPEMAKVLARHDTDAIDGMLHSVVKMGVLDSIIAFDSALKPLGSHQPGLALSAADRAFVRSVNAEFAKQLIQSNDRRSARSHLSFFSADASYTRAIGLERPDKRFLLIAVHPVFNDHGSVAAVLVGHRVVELSDRFLSKYVKAENLGIHILDGEDVLLSTGFSPMDHRNSFQAELGKMKLSRDGTALFQCAVFKKEWRLCVSEPMEQFTALTGALFEFIDNEKNSLWSWLALWGSAVVVVAALIATIATRRVVAPLMQITDALRSVADGNWLVHVSGQRRRDEVGDIARAVADLQKSMKERERLKADVADIDEVHARQKTIEDAIHTCRSELRTHVFNLSDKVEAAETSGATLESYVGLAEGEADEARLITQRAIAALGDDVQGQAQARDIVGSIDRLAETVVQLSAGTKGLSLNIGSMIKEARVLDQVVKRFLLAIGEKAIVTRPRHLDREGD